MTDAMPPASESNAQQEPSAGPRPTRGFSSVGLPKNAARFVWSTFLPVGVSLVSLVLAVYGLRVAREAPDIVMSMPDRVRIADGSTQAFLYVQPRFVNTGDNQRVEVIEGLSITVSQNDTGSPGLFNWEEQGNWTYDSTAETNRLTWQYIADPAPLVVGPSDPQLPICLFMAPTGWFWTPGDYRVTVVANRTVKSDPLSDTFEFTVDQIAVGSLGQGGFWTLRTTSGTA